MNPTENLPSGPVGPPGPATALQLRQQSYFLQTGVATGQAAEAADDSISIKDVLQLLVKYKWVLLAAVLFSTTVAVVQGLTTTPVYQAAVLMQIDRPAARIVQFNRDIDSYQEEDGLMMQTQIELLRSRAMAERVIEDLQLDPTRLRGAVTSVAPGAPVTEAAPAAPSASPVVVAASSASSASESSWLDRLLTGYRRMGKPSVEDGEFLTREALIGRVMGSLAVEPVRNSRLIKIKVSNVNPAQAARLANGIAQTFISTSVERRGQSSVYAKTFLEEQLKATKAKLEESERSLNTYAKKNAILSLDEKTNVLNQTFTEYSSALSRVEQERLKAEAIFTAVQASPESAQQVLENKTVQTYKEQRAKLETEYLTNLAIYKPEFPKMVQIKAQINEMDSRIKAEVSSVLSSLKGQYLAAKQQEDQVRSRFQATRKDVVDTQDKSVDLNLLKRELDTNRQLYDGLLQRLKEVGVTSGVVSNNISVVDAATTPLFPISPNLMKNAGMGLLAGLLLSIGFIFVREHLDDTLKHAEEVEAKFGLPLLGIIPQVKKKPANGLALLAVEDPRSMFAESYRSMRTALQFSTADGAPRRLVVTSSIETEGKSTTALALAINFAQLGQRVLLIDADMRNPSLHGSLRCANEVGLSSCLTGERQLADALQRTSIQHLAVLTSGPHPPSPVDLLMGPRLLEMFDMAEAMGFEKIVVDAPPVLGIADAIVLGNQIPYLLFVIKAGATRLSSIRDALRRLRMGGLMPLGVALTCTAPQEQYYYGSGVYGGAAASPNASGSRLASPPAADRPVSQASA